MSDEVSVSLRIDDDDRARMSTLFGESEVDRILGITLRAGAAEALACATGRAVFSSMTDLRSYRVYCLLEAGMEFDDSERLVAALFKLTPAGARRVVTGALARYEFELGAKVTDSLRARLEASRWVAELKRWQVFLPPGFVRDRALDLCKASDQPNPESKQGAVWAFPHETYNWLREQVGLEERTKPT